MEIKNYLHKGLERFARQGDVSGIQPKHEAKLRALLGALDRASTIKDVTMRSLHCLAKGRPSFKGTYAMRVSGNWRLTFRLEAKTNRIRDLDYLDYH